MNETGTPTLEDLAIAINNAGHAAADAAAEGRFLDARGHARAAAAYADEAYRIELERSLPDPPT